MRNRGPCIDQTASAAGGPHVHANDQNSPVDLGRIAWLATALACLVAAVILVLEGYYGYAGVTFAVALSAAINLV